MESCKGLVKLLKETTTDSNNKTHVRSYTLCSAAFGNRRAIYSPTQHASMFERTKSKNKKQKKKTKTKTNNDEHDKHTADKNRTTQTKTANINITHVIVSVL